jgi:zinc protease
MRPPRRIARPTVWTLLTLLAAAQAGCRQQWVESQATAPLPIDPDLVQGRTSGGMRYLIHPAGGQGSRIALRLVVNVGRVNEAPDEHGLAHFVEHLAFSGSKNFPGGLRPFIESLGVKFGRDANATTGPNHTVYVLNVPAGDPAKLRQALTAFGDIAHRLTFAPETVERERKVLLAERRDNALAFVSDTTAYAVDFPGSRAADRMTRAQDETIIAEAPLDAVRRFHQKWYRPDTASIVVAGPVHPAEMQRLITEEFGEWRVAESPPEVSLRLQERPPARAAAVADLRRNEAEVYFRATRPSLPVGTLGEYRREVIEEFIAGSLHDRFARRVGQSSSQTSSADISRWPFGAVTVSAMVSGPAETWQSTVAHLRAEVEQARRTPMERADLSRGRRTLLREFERRATEPVTAETVARRLVQALIESRALMSPTQELETWKGLAEGLKPKDVDRVFWETFDPAHCGLLIRFPRGRAELPSEADLLGVKAGATPASAVAEPSWKPSPLGRAAATAEVVERSLEPLDVTAVRLSNGVRLNLKTLADADRVVVSILLARGEAETGGVPELASAAAAALSQPVLPQASWTSIRLYLQRHGISLSGRAHSDGLVLRVSAPPSQLDEAINVAYLVLSGAQLDRGTFERWKLERARSTSLGESVRQRLRTVVSGNGPDRGAQDNLSVEQVNRWLRDRVATAPLEVAVVGNLPVERLLAPTQRHLGALPSRPPADPKVAAIEEKFPSPAGAKQMIREATQERNAAVLLAWPIPAAERDRSERQVVRIASRIITRRLRTELREKRGLSYQVTCTVGNMRGARRGFTLYALFTVDPAQAQEAAAVTRQVIERLRAEGPTDQEVTQARDELTQDFRRVYQSPDQWASLLEGRLLRGEDLSDIARNLAGEVTIDRSRIARTLRAALAPASAIEIIGLPAS